MTEKYDSASDKRAAEVNTVRHSYRTLSDDEKAAMVRIKDQGQAIINEINALGTSRELSLAKTKAEECVMWAVKHITA